MPPEFKRELDGAAEIDYRFLVENSADILCSVGLDHVIHYISPSCLEILGWQPAEMIGKNLCRFIFPDDMPALEDLEVGKPPDGMAYTHARVRFLRRRFRLFSG
ncbi:MAG: PAS domain-containing protein [Terriglobia bacterium]|nr:PAS domain-containing protein [Terriglobia bacterium]